MRRAVIVICGLIVCCNSVFGNDDINGINLSDEITYKMMGSEVEKGILQIDTSELSLKEQIIHYFENESDRELYRDYLEDDSSISQGEAAKILCRYIERSPVYLPEKEQCNSPYIGRLVVEYIWGNRSFDEKEIITLADWDTLFNKAKQFKDDKDYLKNALLSDEANIKQKISQYIGSMSKDQSFKKVAIGTMVKSNLELCVNEKFYDVYQFLNTSYISLKTLENIGFKKQANSGLIQLIWQGYTSVEEEQTDFDKKEIYMSNESIYIGELKTHSLSAGEETFIPIRALQVYFNLNIMDNQIFLNPRYDLMSEYILCDNESLINQTDECLKVMYTDLYWDGNEIIEQRSELNEIPAKTKIIKNKELYVLRNAKYLTTIINYLETDYQMIETNSKFGQDHSELFKRYNQEVIKKESSSHTEADKGFPASIIIGTMKYSTNGFAKGQKVEVWAAEDHVIYYVKNSNNKTVKIPWNSISIPKNPPTATDKPTKVQIEDFINCQDISSKTMYLVWTDLYRQKTYIFKGQKNEWQLIRTLLCSTGKNTTPTPRGKFTLTNRVPYFGVDKGYRCKNAFQIFGDYLYHSIIFDVTGTRLLEGKGVLGHRASHGCIRFSEEDSLWFYNTMKSNTTVWIN
ncbi:MAG: L,D-transpeptidase [Clostridia bacterium]|nr:L,D-transpeptidase [Clostridia bacterium]